MQCFECFEMGIDKEAVGLCHHCSAALCADHASLVSDPVTAVYPLVKTVVLPKRARLLLCRTCKEAIEQPRLAAYA
jgi:hypothetical protein